MNHRSVYAGNVMEDPRIKKLLAIAHDPGATDAERDSAKRLAEKLRGPEAGEVQSFPLGLRFVLRTHYDLHIMPTMWRVNIT